LPLRLADFGVLHRNEVSGALSGLTRVRRFQQKVYGIFNFSFTLNLSTRPEKYLGEIEVWDAAEKSLAESLDKSGHPWQLNPGDGAFYGPKIDITIQDALRRSHQCATIQLDFQLPERFNLHYINEKQEHERPVIIHRAILGSVERMMAILCESFGGKWPFWMSPRQAIVITVSATYDDYAQDVMAKIHKAGFLCDFDVDPGTTMNKRIRNAQLAQYNFILVVGEKEVTAKTANVRTRDNKILGEFSIEHIIDRFRFFTDEKPVDAEDKF